MHVCKILKPSLLLIVVLLNPLSAFAYDLERAALNLSADLSECAGFYAIVSQVNKKNTEVAAAYEQGSIYMLEMAIETSNEKAASARMETAIKEMFKELGGDLGNMSILINKYLEMCNGMSDDIESRLQYWLNKKD